jgi:hypothetical protein
VTKTRIPVKTSIRIVVVQWLNVKYYTVVGTSENLLLLMDLPSTTRNTMTTNSRIVNFYNIRSVFLIWILAVSVQSFSPARLVTNPTIQRSQEYQTPFYRGSISLDSTQSDPEDVRASQALIGDDSAYFALEEQVGH